ncbi:Crp/Fnr family transcriptional regulator [Myroides injenensis]|uniref:Crp/Fnr family transcriptional regulator n=1 Tax=Myroides injenensis TaxID=1183151 RepID=UPI000287C500|nr:Crp/Fnr family transcriptional regulator [Myroides injenensis]
MVLENVLQQTLSLTAEELKIALNYFVQKTYTKGSLLQEYNSKCNRLYFLQNGYIRIFSYADGKEITQWISIPNYFVTNLSAWIFDQPNQWNLEALTDISVLEISRENYELLQSYIHNWHQKEKNFICHCFMQMEQRIFNFIALNSQERYNKFFQEYGFLFNEVPHQYIASLLGMTPETLSRIRRKETNK